MKNLFSFYIIIFATLATFAPAQAASSSSDGALDGINWQTLLDPSIGTESPVEVHGFLSQGYIQTTKNNYLPNSKTGTTDFADAGLTLNKMLTNNLRVGMQLFARDFGRTGDYSAKFDWFLLDYRWRDWLGVRAGRVKIPYGLFSETMDIDSARVPILLPQSVYPTDQRDYMLAQTGFDFYGTIDLSSAGSVDYRIYRGTLQISPAATVGLPYQIATSDVPYVNGSRLIWDTPLSGLRLGATYQQLELKSNLYIPSVPTTVATELKVSMGVASVEYTHRYFQFVSEYSRWRGKFDSNLPAVLVPVGVTHERYYGMLSFKPKEWLQPGFYYSVTIPNNELRDRPGDYSKDAAVFCRVDLTANWLFKAEWHYMNGTAGLNPGINNNVAANNMTDHWQMFLAKTTIYF